MSRLGLLGAAALVGVAACQPAETPEQMQTRVEQESAAARQAIQAANANFARWFSAGQSDSAASAYTENAIVMAPNQKAVTGRQDIKTFFDGFFGMGKWTITLNTVSVVANGPVAVESGTYVLGFTPGPSAPPGMAPADTGKYVVHWQRVGEQWMLAHDIFNSDLPLPQPAAPARRR